MSIQIELPHLDACCKLAQKVAEQVTCQQPPLLPLVFGLVGTLGAGKTQWTQFFAQALGAHREDISSPTYVLIHRYPSTPTIYHVDAYRVRDEEEFLELGIEELFDAQAITIVEWADRFRNVMPRETIWITFHLDPDNPSHRKVTIDNLPATFQFGEPTFDQT